ncbi:MAG: hypothetical protein WCX29_03670 [Candidatus Peribacteraceae bacterium]
MSVHSPVEQATKSLPQQQSPDREVALLLDGWKQEVWHRLFEAFNYDYRWNMPEQRRELVMMLVAACNSEPPELTEIAATERRRLMEAVRYAPPSDFMQPRPVIAFLDRVFTPMLADTNHVQNDVAQHGQSS